MTLVVDLQAMTIVFCLVGENKSISELLATFWQ